MKQQQAMANAIRFLTIDTLVKAKEGHPGTPLGGADIMTALFNNHMDISPENPTWPDRDRFVHSAGHGSMLLYSVLHLCGYQKLNIDEIKNFRVLGSHTPGHPEHDPLAGIETTTGPLGQGIGNAVGMALAESILNHKFGDDIVNHYTYAYVGDGCLMEGIAAEVISLAGHLKLGKLIFFWDDNEMTDDGSTELSISDDIKAHFKASNWQVQSVDGHDINAISEAINKAKAHPQPSVIACKTIIGKGLSRVQGTRAAHGQPITIEDANNARKELNWPHDPYEIPDDISHNWRSIGEKGNEQYQHWKKRFEQLPNEKQQQFIDMHEGLFSNDWQAEIVKFKQDNFSSKQPQSTILSSADLVNRLSLKIEHLISGAPDLEGTTQHKQSLDAYSADNKSGRYVHYGVREHAMGAIINGMVLHKGLVAVGATYLVFSDYMRPAIRMAALMQIPSIFVFSHDSIGIGTNGATHQPVETIASLRAIPHLLTLRPADAIELAECWEVMLKNQSGPSALVCSRQNLPIIRQETFDLKDNRCQMGAYILKESALSNPQVTIMATGSEVAIALSAQTILEQNGISTHVVSMPCWELFEQQNDQYKKSVINKNTLRVGIEAAVKFGWERYIGENGLFIGMQSFGASGTTEALFEHFKITAEHLVDEVTQRLQQSV